MNNFIPSDWNSTCRIAIAKKHEVTVYKNLNYVREPSGLLFFELYTATGYGRGNPQRIDAFHMSDLPSANYMRTAYEIKVSKRDFMSELKQPNKRRAALLYSNLFYFVTPKGLVNSTQVPLECGLIEVSESGRSDIVVKAPWRDGAAPTWALAASMARHLVRKK